MMTYVTYDEAGNLTGYYIQELQPEHEGCYIELIGYPADFYMQWFNYRANDARDGIELIPMPDEPPAE